MLEIVFFLVYSWIVGFVLGDMLGVEFIKNGWYGFCFRGVYSVMEEGVKLKGVRKIC